MKLYRPFQLLILLLFILGIAGLSSCALTVDSAGKPSIRIDAYSAKRVINEINESLRVATK